MRKKLYIQLISILCLIALVLSVPFNCINVKAAPIANATIVNVSKYVNLRERPSTKSNLLTTVDLGTRVAFIEEVTRDADDESSSTEWSKIVVAKNGKEYTGYILSKYLQKDSVADNPVGDTSFEESIAAFPDSYKPYLRDLHSKHPTWVFHADNVGLTWDFCLEKETKDGVSLVVDSTDPTWQSYTNPNVVDSPNWVNASKPLVAYYMDPRNMLTESSVFQFVDLNYTDNSINPDNINQILTGTFMAEPVMVKFDGEEDYYYKDIFALAGNLASDDGKGINPVFLAAHAIQECGTKGSVSSLGENGFYNFYNIGAYSDAINAAAHGLDLAQNGLDAAFNATYHIPWNTQGLSIVYGGKWIYDHYTVKGQYTLYYMRWNVSPKREFSACSHQYMTATQSVSMEGQRMFEAYKASGLLDTKIDFYIPVYQEMPNNQSEIPTTSNAHKDYVKELYVKFFNRNASDGELSSFCNLLGEGYSAGVVAEAFILSDEFKNKKLSDDDYIKLLYSTFANREAKADEINKMKNLISDGYSRLYVFQQIINSDEAKSCLSYYNVSVADYTSSDFVDKNMHMKPLVVQLYKGVLGRNPDRDGLRNWISVLAEGRMSGPQVAAAFCMSPEMEGLNLSNEEFVRRLYVVCLGREPDEEGAADWLKKLNDFYTREYVVSGFVNSIEFGKLCAKYSGVKTDNYKTSTVKGLSPNSVKIKAFVTRLYSLALEREPDEAGLNDWVAGLKNGTKDGYVVAYGFIFSEEMKSLNLTNEEFVTRLYRIFLNREPDVDGFNDWVKKLDDGASRESVFEGFVYSQEFIGLCLDAGFKPYKSYKIST